MTLRWTSLWLAAACVSGLVAASSWPVAAVATDPAPVQPVVVLEEDEPQQVYPMLSRTMAEQRLAELIFDRFFTLSSGGEVVSAVFQPGWRPRSPNLTVNVREGLKWSDGTPVSFGDVSFTINEVYRRAELGHRAAAWYAQVFGDAQQITPNAGSVRFQIAMPDEGAEKYLLTTPLLSRQSIAPQGKPELERTRRAPVGTGPFMVQGTIENFDDVTLVRNPHRLDAPAAATGAAPVGAVRLLYDQDAARQKELILGERADIWVAPPPAVLPEFESQGAMFGQRSYDLNQWWYIAVNPANPHLALSAVREALDSAVPRQQLVEKLGADSVKLCSGPFLPGSAWEPGDLSPTAEDRAAVERLMNGAGFARQAGLWTSGGAPVDLRVGVQSDLVDDYGDVVFGLENAWRDAGFGTRIRPIRASDWRSIVETGRAAEQFDLILGRWSLDREEAALDLFRKGKTKDSRVDLFGWSDSEVDEIVQSFYRETSGPKREALMQKMHRVVRNARPYLFLWTLEVKSVYRRDKLAGFKPTPYYYFTDVGGLNWKAPAGG